MISLLFSSNNEKKKLDFIENKFLVLGEKVQMQGFLNYLSAMLSYINNYKIENLLYSNNDNKINDNQIENNIPNIQEEYFLVVNQLLKNAKEYDNYMENMVNIYKSFFLDKNKFQLLESNNAALIACVEDLPQKSQQRKQVINEYNLMIKTVKEQIKEILDSEKPIEVKDKLKEFMEKFEEISSYLDKINKKDDICINQFPELMSLLFNYNNEKIDHLLNPSIKINLLEMQQFTDKSSKLIISSNVIKDCKSIIMEVNEKCNKFIEDFANHLNENVKFVQGMIYGCIAEINNAKRKKTSDNLIKNLIIKWSEKFQQKLHTTNNYIEKIRQIKGDISKIQQDIEKRENNLKKNRLMLSKQNEIEEKLTELKNLDKEELSKVNNNFEIIINHLGLISNKILFYLMAFRSNTRQMELESMRFPSLGCDDQIRTVLIYLTNTSTKGGFNTKVLKERCNFTDYLLANINNYYDFLKRTCNIYEKALKQYNNEFNKELIQRLVQWPRQLEEQEHLIYYYKNAMNSIIEYINQIRKSNIEAFDEITKVNYNMEELNEIYLKIISIYEKLNEVDFNINTHSLKFESLAILNLQVYTKKQKFDDFPSNVYLEEIKTLLDYLNKVLNHKSWSNYYKPSDVPLRLQANYLPLLKKLLYDINNYNFQINDQMNDEEKLKLPEKLKKQEEIINLYMEKINQISLKAQDVQKKVFAKEISVKTKEKQDTQYTKDNEKIFQESLNLVFQELDETCVEIQDELNQIKTTINTQIKKAESQKLLVEQSYTNQLAKSHETIDQLKKEGKIPWTSEVIHNISHFDLLNNKSLVQKTNEAEEFIKQIKQENPHEGSSAMNNKKSQENSGHGFLGLALATFTTTSIWLSKTWDSFTNTVSNLFGPNNTNPKGAENDIDEVRENLPINSHYVTSPIENED